MPQIVNTNLFSLNAQRNLNESQNALGQSLQRLSSGLRINSAKDDAAGLAIAERFTSQIRGLNQAIRNANDGISFAQTAEGGLSTSTSALQRIRELAVQSANDTNSASDRGAINNEVQQLIAEVRRIATTTQFNGQNVLDGSSSSLSFQVGANQNQTITVDGVDARSDVLGARVSTSGSIDQTAIDASVAAAAGAGDLVINGIAVDFSGLSAGASVNDIAQQINAVTSLSGVSAQTATTVLTEDLAQTAGTATINGVTVTLLAGSSTANRDANVAAINALTGQTGVTAASGAGNTLTLSNSDGTNIVVGGGTNLGGAAETYSAGLVLAGNVGQAYTATGTFAVQGASNGVAAVVLGASQTDQSVTNTNVLTQADSTAALLTLDFALSQVNTLRSELGAVQTRFESTISNLQITSENLTAARSRIQDADFAAETADLTRGQILQQAGLSIVAQANSLPQSVLSLLQ
ncbi:MAG: flagellin [Gammaproteobacteria bacterium]|nr:flagellin [Gammaproteobacteria bacterium]